MSDRSLIDRIEHDPLTYVFLGLGALSLILLRDRRSIDRLEPWALLLLAIGFGVYLFGMLIVLELAERKRERPSTNELTIELVASDALKDEVEVALQVPWLEPSRSPMPHEGGSPPS